MSEDELKAISMRALNVYHKDQGWDGYEDERALPVVVEDVPRLIAEIRRLQTALRKWEKSP